MHLGLTRKIRNDDKAVAKFLRDARNYTSIDSVFGPNLIEPLSGPSCSAIVTPAISYSQCGCSAAKIACQFDTFLGIGNVMLL